MKKRLEAELISIAHRVLKLKNKSEVDQLFLETQKLYEALSVLKFYGDHIDQVKDTISEADLEEKLADSLENKSIKKDKTEEPIEAVKEEPIPVVAVEEENETSEEAHVVVGEINIDEEDDIEEEVVDQEEEITEEEPNFDPIFEMASEEPEAEETEAKKEEEVTFEPAKTQQISFEHLLGEDYKEPEFVKPNDVTTHAPAPIKEEEPVEILVEKKEDPSLKGEQAKQKPSGLNDRLAAGINIGLNDRIGFVKYLFDNSTEDYNRVLSQLNTFSSYADAKEFIDEMVKPDYNNWTGQEDYAERFLEIVEKKFS